VAKMRERKAMNTKRNLTGMRFGNLLCESPSESRRGHSYSNCKCDCGNTVVVKNSNLLTGNSTRCKPCASTESATIHGMTGTRTHNSFKQMHNRCSNPKRYAAHRYIGRGIKVCERWSSFENFLADMGERPIGKTLDRINNDGNYEPSNCRWATPKEQASNKSPRCEKEAK